LLSGERRAGAVKARRPRADYARGRSEATSLARRRAQLKARMRDGRADYRWSHIDTRARPDDEETRFLEDMGKPQHSQTTCGRRGRKDDGHRTGAETATDGQPGRERPSRQGLGRSRGAEIEGRSRPSSPLRHFGAAAAGGKGRRPVDCQPSPQRCASPAVRCTRCSENHSQGRRRRVTHVGGAEGTLLPRASSPLVCPLRRARANRCS